MEGMKVWVSTLIEYDKFGTATVLRSFAKPALDSAVKGIVGKKKVAKKVPIKPKVVKKKDGEKSLWETK